MDRNTEKYSMIEEFQQLYTEIQSTRSQTTFHLYPFSNEHYFSRTLEKLEKASKPGIEGVKAGIFTGESHILSSLPELQDFISIIILNDINEQNTKHTKFLVKCLLAAKSIDEFADLYKDEKENPLVTDQRPITKLWESMTSHQDPNVLDVRHFLKDQERFNACKEAAKKLVFLWSNINLLDSGECKSLKLILNKYNTTVALLNVSNLHNYDDLGRLPATVAYLLKGNNRPIILYSIGYSGPLGRNILFSKISFELQEYLNLLKSVKEYKSTPKKFSPLELKELTKYFNNVIIPELVGDFFGVPVPKIIYDYDNLKIAMPKISKYSSASQLKIYHKISAALLPWYAQYIEPVFLTALSNKTITLDASHLEKTVDDYKQNELNRLDNFGEDKLITEHTISYSMVRYEHWSSMNIFPARTPSFKEIKNLIQRYELLNSDDPNQAIQLLDELLEKIKLYKRAQITAAPEEILEYEEGAMLEKSRLLHQLSSSQAYLDL